MTGFGAALAQADGPTALFALGQAGFALRGREQLVLIDPWLSTALEETEHVTRPAPPAMRPEDAEGVALVCVTHEHPDHLDPVALAAIARRCPDARFVAPRPAVGLLADAGVPADRIAGIRAEETVTASGVPVTAFPAAHRPDAAAFGGYAFWRDDAGEHRALGYLVELDGRRVAHVGDTVWWPGLERALAGLRPDVLILPINGRDPLREAQDLWGNLDAEEAAALAVAADAPVVIPCHFDGVAGNLGDPQTFLRALEVRGPEVAAHVLHPGDRLEL